MLCLLILVYGLNSTSNLVAVFQTPMDCDYMPNDVVPIAVGITLALLIVFILVFYIIGRRRQRFSGYESV